MKHLLNELKDGGFQALWARAYSMSSIFVQTTLAVAFPIIAVGSLIFYFVFAHVVHIWYTSSFWMLLACAWALPPCFFFLYLYIQKRRASKRELYAMDSEDFGERNTLIRGRGGLINEEEDVRYEDEEEGDEDRPPKKSRMKKSFSLDFISDGYVEHKFIPTIWNGLGITACVFGILASFMGLVCNFLAGDVSGGFAAMVTLFTVGSCMYLIIHRSVGVNQSSYALQDMTQETERNVKTMKWLVLAWKLACVVAGLIAVIITILASLQSFVVVFNAHHYRPPGIMYHIGNSRHMHMHCQGTGGPTVIFLHGSGGQAYDWIQVLPSVSMFSKVCTLDRTGYGWSSPPNCQSCPRTAKERAKDLNSLFLASQIANESLVFVAHAEAVLDVRVFVNTYNNYRVCGVVCVDCIDTGNLQKIGAHAKNPIPVYWDMWRNLLPTGLLGVLAAGGNLQKFDMIHLLPTTIQTSYIQNELKVQYPETVVMDEVYLPQAAQQAVDAGGFGSLRMIAIIAGKGLNATGVALLSTNSTLVYVPNAPREMAFHEVFANIIGTQVRGAISYSRYANCAV